MAERGRLLPQNLGPIGRDPVRLTIFVIVGLALSWLTISHSVVAYLSRIAPERALLLRANDPASLLALADKATSSGVAEGAKSSESSQSGTKSWKALRERVETALAGDPLSAKAWRLLGQIAERENFAQRAETLMRLAARLSSHESFAVDWMMRKSFERKDYAATAYYADALLRSGQSMPYVIPFLALTAEAKDGGKEIVKLLAARPNWRVGFFDALNYYVTDARTPLKLFLNLKDTPARAKIEELNAYQAFLFEHKLYDLAYYVWVEFLPPQKLEKAGFLFNGDFETKPSGSPFDWQASPGVNVISDFARRPDNPKNHALVVEFGPGRVEFPGVRQSIVLPPGAYALKGLVNGELVGRRGAQWGVSCIGGTSLGESEMMIGTLSSWRDFAFSFVVPEAGCPAQLVQLNLAARSASEQLVSGVIWFDELSISRKAKEN